MRIDYLCIHTAARDLIASSNAISSAFCADVFSDSLISNWLLSELGE